MLKKNGTETDTNVSAMCVITTLRQYSIDHIASCQTNLIATGFYLSQARAIKTGSQDLLPTRPLREVKLYPRMACLEGPILVSLLRRKLARHMKIGEEVETCFSAYI
jgi:hypothetical protein